MDELFLCISFIGKLPEYTIECVHQIRLFFNGDIYLILNDFESTYLGEIKKFNVKLINYYDVYPKLFNNIVDKNKHKFAYLDNLTGREELFTKSLERFFLLYNLMLKNNLENCLFLEIDNLIYDNPNNWLEEFKKHELCYMYDNENRFSSGIMYIKNAYSLVGFMNYVLNFINTTKTNFINEMYCLSQYYEASKATYHVHILPTHWPEEEVPNVATDNFDKYKNTLFDSAGMGIYLTGINTFHTNGELILFSKFESCKIDYTNNKFEWFLDEKNRKIPHIWNGESWLKINNLHIHSKLLKNALSIEMK